MADLERLLILGVRPDAAGGLPPKGGEGDSPMRSLWWRRRQVECRRPSLRDAWANGRGIPWDKSHGYQHGLAPRGL